MRRNTLRVLGALASVALALNASGCLGTTNGGRRGGRQPQVPATPWAPPASGADPVTAQPWAPPEPEQPPAPPASQGEVIPAFVDANPGFFNFPVQRDCRFSYGPRFEDYEAHSPASYGSQYWDRDVVTHAHETTHGINSWLRNHYNKTGTRANGFYVGLNRGIVIVEPRIRKSQVVPYVPAPLRGSRFNLYLLGMRDWDDTPLYIVDEWVAYTNGGETGVDAARRGLLRDKSNNDGIVGVLEFTIYTFAMARAVAAADPQGWPGNYRKLHAFIAWNSARAMDVYRQGIRLPTFAWRTPLLEEFTRGSAARDLRQFVQATWGETFWQRVVLGQ